jgi:23S rRNA pseudouridine2605 synthase
MHRLKRMGLDTHIMPVGRLDFHTEGLLILTNDGEYARALEHPQYEIPRVYRAFVFGQVLPSKIAELKKGVVVDGIQYRPIHVTVESQYHSQKGSRPRPSRSKASSQNRRGKIDEEKRTSDPNTETHEAKNESWLCVKLSEGKNREVRKALAHVRLVVKRLIRVEYGPYRLADLSKGDVLEVRPKAI